MPVISSRISNGFFFDFGIDINATFRGKKMDTDRAVGTLKIMISFETQNCIPGYYGLCRWHFSQSNNYREPLILTEIALKSASFHLFIIYFSMVR